MRIYHEVEILNKRKCHVQNGYCLVFYMEENMIPDESSSLVSWNFPEIEVFARNVDDGLLSSLPL